ncbi:adenosylmethionine--8-amino-7-oxononanoate transaminase [Corynebacterium mendelii]|uniref:Adenosylmethionine-8-amino-7-oxononanoate aminotransferase n=1 Tax=Corynebacterium mendelii TaxID=2765362 RepID=A0A939E0F7_9CORY|nr:adenosylmethionine--8-amino-7-oxononanoate transaminase [Corynebacterium mendelii]MBN9643578.1 adenosylmethionine--8-amino-7-oxononanoate transaminase [Corynebacterium mendelii]
MPDFSSPAAVIDYDQQHVWHPYAPTPAPVAPVPVAQARGVYLTLMDGRRVIDGMSSWWCACHGHSHPALVAAAHRQIDVMSHVMFGGLTHEPAVRLAEKIVAMTPPGLEKVFFADSGSVSVEVAVKMALQYQRGIGHPERNRLVTWRSGYHGDTFAPMSVCDPDGGMHSLWQGSLPKQIFAPPPPPIGSPPEVLASYAEQFIGLIDETVAAVIVEPVVQGAGGMRFHDPSLVAAIAAGARRRNRLFIADEIATGFGRTGHLFACRWAGVTPDILCLGKALTGGFMTMAATVATRAVAEAIQTPAGGGALMHGPTFMGNPLAAAVAAASLELIESGYWTTAVPRIERQLTDGLAPLAQRPDVADVRVLGAIGVVEMTAPVDMAATQKAALDHGVWLRPFGRLIYTMPPFVSTPGEVDTIIDAITAAVDAATGDAPPAPPAQAVTRPTKPTTQRK